MAFSLIFPYKIALRPIKIHKRNQGFFPGIIIDDGGKNVKSNMARYPSRIVNRIYFIKFGSASVISGIKISNSKVITSIIRKGITPENTSSKVKGIGDALLTT